MVRQFLNARKIGPIGMSEEKDVSELEAEATLGHDPGKLPPIPPQLMTTDGQHPPRPAPARRVAARERRHPAGRLVHRRAGP